MSELTTSQVRDALRRLESHALSGNQPPALRDLARQKIVELQEELGIEPDREAMSFGAFHAMKNPGHVVKVFVDQTDTIMSECTEPDCQWWDQILL